MAATDAMLSDWYASYLKQAPQAVGYTPAQAKTTNWTVDKNQTVAGQLANITSKGNPLWQLATTKGNQIAARRGMLGSTMGVEAAQKALYEAATPIATADAQMYGRAGEFNAGQANETARFNTGETNKAGMFKADWGNRFAENSQKLAGESMLQGQRQAWETGENAAQRTWQTGENVSQRDWQSGENVNERGWRSGENEKDRTFTAGENQRGREFQTSERLGTEQFQSGQAEAERGWRSGERQAAEDFQRSERLAQNEFGATEAEKARNFESAQTAQQHSNELERMGFANKLATASVPGQFAASVSQTTMAQVGVIMADPNLDPEAKKAAIQNLVDYANSTLSWAEKFYAVDLPEMSVPGQAAPPVMGPQPTQPVSTAPAVDPIAQP